MKELSIEEKAKRYDEAIKKAGERYNEEYTSTLERSTLVYVFPELKESEDERIRKELISHFDDLYHDNLMELPSLNTIESWIAWLEKQGNPTVIIPKFRVGDEIKTSNEESLTITKIDEKGYWSEDLFICNFDDADKWKLVEQKSAWSEEDERRLNIICGLLEDIPSHQNWLRTLKDRVLMTKVTYGERDKEKLESIINKASYNCCLKNDDISFLKSLKDRVSPQPNQKWSEEDETKIKIIIALLKSPALCCMEGNKGIIDASIKYLKSFKDRVQPKQEWDEEDEKHRLNCLSYFNMIEKTSPYYEDYLWLKSLKDRVSPQPRSYFSNRSSGFKFFI